MREISARVTFSETKVSTEACATNSKGYFGGISGVELLYLKNTKVHDILMVLGPLWYRVLHKMLFMLFLSSKTTMFNREIYKAEAVIQNTKP